MTRALIISDSHGLTRELENIKSRHKTDIFIHCGDSELEMDAPELEGFYTVAGNCDFDNRYPSEQKMEFESLSFLVLHGHKQYVKRDLTALTQYASETNASVVCFGHTHVAGALVYNGQLFINPGSVYRPKLYDESSYAILEWDAEMNVKVNFFNVEGEALEHFDFLGNLHIN